MTSWLTSAIQTVRDKSVDALDFVRRDLTEFTSTVKTDAESYLNKIKSQEVGDLGINQFVSKLSGAYKTDDQSEKQVRTSASFDRVHTELARLQNDESTYLTDPTPTEAFETWRQTTDFNVDEHKGEIAQLLIDAPHVRSFYAHLVPAQTTHVDFWSRYYYRVHQLEQEEARRTQLLRRAHEICSENTDNTEENNANDWDEPDDILPEQRPLANVSKEVTIEVAPVVHDEEHQESTQTDSSFEKPTHEHSGSDTVSGDSWEREFDETDLPSASIPSTSDADSLTKSAETVTSESVSSLSTVAAAAAATTITTTITPAPSSTNKKKENEFDDDWESWS